jgi:hypothetical protein
MNLNKHPGIVFTNSALLLLMLSMLASSLLLGSYGAALALVGWGLGLLAALRRRHWRWVVAMLLSGLVVLLIIVTASDHSIYLLFISINFLSALQRQLFATVLAGAILIPTVFYASSDALEASTSDDPFSRDHRPDIVSIGLVLLGLFFLLLMLRFLLAGSLVLIDV